MGRPRKQTSKTEIITTRTTIDYKLRFEKVCERKGLKGDDWLVLFLGNFEKEDDYLKTQSLQEKMRIKQIDKEIRDLQNERISCETNLDEIKNKSNSNDNDVEQAVTTILQRFQKQSVYNILEWLSENQNFVSDQAFLCGIPASELEDLVFDRA